jgi:hypothetical protein
LSFEELKRLDVGGGHTIPSLEELFIALEERHSSLELNLELKGEKYLPSIPRCVMERGI